MHVTQIKTLKEKLLFCLNSKVQQYFWTFINQLHEVKCLNTTSQVRTFMMSEELSWSTENNQIIMMDEYKTIHKKMLVVYIATTYFTFIAKY